MLLFVVMLCLAHKIPDRLRGYLFELKEFTEDFSRALSLGWVAQADKLHHLVFSMKPASPLWHRDTFDPRWEKPREPWGRFTLALCSDFYGHPLPPMPAHPYDSPAFDALLACWRHPDPQVLAEPLLAVCDWHTHECMYSRSDQPSKRVDFIDDTLMGWPVEAHTVLRLRERLGLALPPLPEHPLMQTPMGPYRAPVPVPMDERLQRFCARAFAEVPGLLALLGDAIPGAAPVAQTVPPRPDTRWPAPGPAPEPQVGPTAFEIGVGLAGVGLRLEPLPPAAVEELRHLAGEARRVAADAFGVHLDGSADSLAALDGILDQTAETLASALTPPDDARLQEFIALFAAYLGEVFCAEQGACWKLAQLDHRQAHCVNASTGSKPILFPFDRVAARLHLGPRYRLLPQYAEAVRLAAA